MTKSKNICIIAAIVIIAMLFAVSVSIMYQQNLQVAALADDGTQEVANDAKGYGIYIAVGISALLLAVVIAVVVVSNKKYILRFIVGKHSVPLPPRKHLGGEELGDLPCPVRKGAKFGGWYSDPYLKDPFTKIFMPKKDIEIYAKWRRSTRRY